MSELKVTPSQQELINKYRSEHKDVLLLNDAAIISILQNTEEWKALEVPDNSMWGQKIPSSFDSMGLQIEKTTVDSPIKKTETAAPVPLKKNGKLKDTFNSNLTIIDTAVKDKKTKELLFKLNNAAFFTKSEEFDKEAALKKIQSIAMSSFHIKDEDDIDETNYKLQLGLSFVEDYNKWKDDTCLRKFESVLEDTQNLTKGINYVKYNADASNIFQTEDMKNLIEGMKTSPTYFGVIQEMEATDPDEKQKLAKLSGLGYMSGEIKNSVRYAPLKSYFKENSSPYADDKYKECYSAKQPPHIAKALDRILDEYGVKVFLSENKENISDEETLEKIFKEFDEWKKTGNEDVIYPNILDLNCVSEEILLGRALGATHMQGDIQIKTNESLDIALRHEMTHLNDQKRAGFKLQFENFDTNPLKRFIPEFKKAGIGNFYAEKYAFKDKYEFLAVASQGDMSTYSDELKKLLVELGMPEWELKLKYNPDINAGKNQ